MPTVPQYDGPKVDTAPVTGYRSSLRLSGQDPIADSLGHAANVGMEIHRQEKARTDDAAFQEAANQIKEQDNALHYDKATGIYHQSLGRDAWPAVDKALEKLDQTSATIESKLGNDEQKRAFKSWYGNHRMARKQHSDEYAFNEKTRWEDDVHKTFLQGVETDAINLADNFEAVKTAAWNAENKIRSYGAARNKEALIVEQEIGEAKSRIHTGAIITLLSSGNDVAARNRFKDVGDQIQGKDKVQVQRALEIGSTEGESQRKALAIYNDKKTIVEMVAEADQIKDTKIRDATVQRLHARRSEHLQAVNEQQRGAAKAIYDATTDPENAVGFDDPSLIEEKALLEPAQLEALKSYARRGQTGTDLGIYQGLRLMAADPASRAQFLKLNLYADPRFAGKLDESAFKEILGLQVELIKDGSSAKATKMLTGLQSVEDVVSNALASKGIDPRPFHIEKGEVVTNPKAVAFRSLLDKQVIGWKQANQKTEIPPEKVQEFADKLLIQEAATVDAGTFAKVMTLGMMQTYVDPKGRYAFENPTTVGEAMTLEQVPREYHDQLAAALNEDGVIYDADPAAYDREMVRRYNLWLKKTNAGK